MGPLMVLFGWCFMAIAFTKPAIPALVPVGLAGFVVSGSLLGYVMLAYPSGELRTTANRLLQIERPTTPTAGPLEEVA